VHATKYSAFGVLRYIFTFHIAFHYKTPVKPDGSYNRLYLPDVILFIYHPDGNYIAYNHNLRTV